MAWTCDPHREVLARADIFRGVETGTVTALTRELRVVEFPCGHTVYAEGDRADRVYVIITGKVKIGRCLPDGRERLLAVVGPSDTFGELSVFDRGPRTWSAITVTRVRAASKRSPTTGPPASPSSCCGWRGVSAPRTVARCASPTTVNRQHDAGQFSQRGWIRLDGKGLLICEPERLARRARLLQSLPRCAVTAIS